MVTGGWFLRRNWFLAEIDTSWKVLRDTLRKKERAYVLDEKFTPVSKIEVALGESIPPLIPTWFLASWSPLKKGLGWWRW
jgi:hypothetical protein